MAESIVLRVSHSALSAGRIEGFHPIWAYYVAGSVPEKHCQFCFKGRLVAPVIAGEGFAWGTPRRLFAMAPYVDADNSFLWDISPSDGRFLMLRRLASGARPKLVMVENFPTELRARLKR